MNKKLLFIFMAAGLMVSCNNGKENNGGNEGQTVNTDTALSDMGKADSSTVNPEIKGEQTVNAESATQNTKVDINEILALIPKCKDVMNGKWQASTFKKNGYKVSTKKEFNDQLGEYETYITSAQLEPAPGVKITFKDTFGGYKLTIDGDSEILNKTFEEAKSYVTAEKKKYKDDPWAQEWYAKKNGNTIVVNLAAD